MKKNITLFILLFLSQLSIAQPTTVGLLYSDSNVTDGYTLFTPSKNNEVFLVNNCGQKVNQWSFTELPGAVCYLLPNGNLLRAGKNNLEIRDWNNNVVWTYATLANNILQHHDIEPLPNGNIICLVTDQYSLADITNEGRNPAITDTNLKLDKVIEIHPIGTNGASIVWEWKFNDHIIQDFDASKLNYGTVGDHPELFDINYNNGFSSDYTHCNAIDYNAALDQIMISARHTSEIYIIDHSTTTAQAAGHTGGNSNHGGDFLWRWGNPEMYRQGTAADRKLFYQHDCKWVEPGYLDDGKITVFNNGDPNSNQTFTSVVMLQPNIVNDIYTKSNNKFNPSTYDWSWNGSILGVVVNEPKQSGTHSLPNGNIIISETTLGRVSEITKSGTLLWSYRNPSGEIVGSSPNYYPQFTTALGGNNIFFRAEKYPANFPGLMGHDLTTGIDILEDQNALSSTCSSLASNESQLDKLFVLNPTKNNRIQFSNSIDADSITIFDINGRLVYHQNSFSGNTIEVNLSPAIYLMQIQQGSSTKKLKIVVSP